ncbi:hypothetical protein [Scytonema sp. HK-05]|uniref:hypothetical protein n=1 Tax=Scytonema sp. HK-05 TaxID=1137095 RepID=UPI001161512B|nr:hypothetical protein [Scytonema sp. HK-05]
MTSLASQASLMGESSEAVTSRHAMAETVSPTTSENFFRTYGLTMSASYEFILEHLKQQVGLNAHSSFPVSA